jgi:hypothetical protein
MSYYGLGLLLGQVIRNMGANPSRSAVGPAIEAIVGYNNGILATSFGKGVHLGTVSPWPVVCCSSDNTWKGDGPAASHF